MFHQSHKVARAAALACGIALSGAAFAQDAGFYVLGALGRSSADIDTSAFSTAGATGITSDDEDTGWKFNIGYQINRNWGIELGYVDFGQFSVDGNLLGVPVNAKVDVTAWTLAAVGTLPVGENFALLAKLGAARGKFSGNGTVGATVINLGDNSTDVFGGIGARYNINRNFGVQFDYERYYFDDRTRIYTLGLRYKF